MDNLTQTIIANSKWLILVDIANQLGVNVDRVVHCHDQQSTALRRAVLKKLRTFGISYTEMGKIAGITRGAAFSVVNGRKR